MSKDLDDLVKVVDQIDPTVLTSTDISSLKDWAAEKTGLVVVDMNTQQILFATQGAEEIFGYMRDEMIGLDLLALVPNEFKNVHPSHVGAFNKMPSVRSMGKRDKPLMGLQRDGDTFPVEISLYPRKFKSLRICVANVVRLSKEV